MNAQTVSIARSESGLFAAVGAALIGMSIIFATGLAQAATLHDAAHDVLHATGFPCH